MEIQEFNTEPPKIMHIDLNSCFATVEQQAHVHLRGKPVVMAAYDSPRGFILSASTEARRLGIKMLMRVTEARAICPDIIVRMPNTVMIRDVHRKFRKIFSDYSPTVIPKSIDEAIIDFTESYDYWKRDLVDIGREIKLRMRQEIGEWISCSVGISTNRLLAKTAAGLTKPDGLDVITYKNIHQVMSRLKLTDLNGIASHNQARLNRFGIFTPLQLLNTHYNILWKQVFQSILGFYWYKWLRGWEAGTIETQRKSIGQQYALGKPTSEEKELAQLIMKLCEKMGRRLRRARLKAQGIHLACRYKDWTVWQKGKKTTRLMYTTVELYQGILSLLRQQPQKKVVSLLQVTCFNLVPNEESQSALFETVEDRQEHKLHVLTDIMDQINDKYGEFIVSSATMMAMDDTIIDRIAFGGVRDISDIY